MAGREAGPTAPRASHTVWPPVQPTRLDLRKRRLLFRRKSEMKPAVSTSSGWRFAIPEMLLQLSKLTYRQDCSWNWVHVRRIGRNCPGTLHSILAKRKASLSFRIKYLVFSTRILHDSIIVRCVRARPIDHHTVGHRYRHRDARRPLVFAQR